MISKIEETSLGGFQWYLSRSNRTVNNHSIGCLLNKCLMSGKGCFMTPMVIDCFIKTEPIEIYLMKHDDFCSRK